MAEPFRIGTVELGASAGRIGICRLPGAGGGLEPDLGAIGKWQPAIVVSMTEAAEMAMLGAGDLPERLEGIGAIWRHFPVVDFGTPAPDASWAALSAELHKSLESGQNVLLHCRGGLGRSGMVALRLMVERGEAVEQALTRLRAARPGAVETKAQLAWASRK